MSQLHDDFFDEACENLDLIERRLLALDAKADSRDRIDAIFRCAHSIKGASATLGFADIAAFVHLIESALHRMREDSLALDAPAIGLLLESVDAARALLARQQAGSTVGAAVPAALEQRLRASAALPESSAATRSLLVRFGPLTGAEDLAATVALFRDIPGLGAIAPLPDEEAGIRAFAVRTDTSDEGLLALFAFHIPVEKVSIHEFHDPALPGVGLGDAGQSVARQNVARQGVAGQMVAGRAAGDELPGAGPGASLPWTEGATLRVARRKIDELSQRIGALARAGNLLRESSLGLDPQRHPELFAALRDMQRETQELQRCADSIRLAPIGTVFQRLPRLLRDLAARLGKQFTLTTRGEEAEVDKAVLQGLADTLMHLVRNSCDHGIETPAERRASGKPEMGTIALAVEQRDGMLLVEVRDDGRGLLREPILKAATRRGLPVSAATPDAELWQLLFAPGFSTLDAASEVSGRGVGMDAVRRNVMAMGGSVSVSSIAGCGATVSMCLPASRT